MELSSDVDGGGVKLKLKQIQLSHRGPQGHGAGPTSFYLGRRVLLDHCFFHGYQVLAFVLMDELTGLCFKLRRYLI